jgi:hypothetical protein
MSSNIRVASNALKRGISTGRGKAAVGALAVATAVIVAILRPIHGPDPRIDTHTVQLKNGWIMNCAGSAFSGTLKYDRAGKASLMPAFRINDQLVLAVPTSNSPSANSIASEPSECRKLTDLPLVAYLSFAIQGDWSAGYKPKDVLATGGSLQFLPDAVGVRIELEFSKFSVEEQRQRQELLAGTARRDSIGMQEIGSLTCFVSKNQQDWTGCFASPAQSTDFTRIRIRKYRTTPFILVLADYPSLRYGGIHMFWKAWTSDLSHVPDIDAAIWKSIEEWNLLKTAESQARH